MSRMLKKNFIPIIIGEGTSEDILVAPGYGNTLYFIWIIISIWFILGILLSIWVYKDAHKRVHNENIWIMIVLFLSVVGFLIYMFFREEEISIEEEIDHDKEIQSL